jgi:hypothetical protein
LKASRLIKAYRIDDQTALTIVYQLLREEGLFLGLSSEINVAGALRFAKKHGRGQTLVTLLCDLGHKYQSTLYNREWPATSTSILAFRSNPSPAKTRKLSAKISFRWTGCSPEIDSAVAREFSKRLASTRDELHVVMCLW